jgi:acetyltransferase
VRFSQLVVEQRLIKELDINPLLASPDRLIALDARVVLYEPGTNEDDVPPLAIRPYPLQYVAAWTAKDGTPLVIRPIRPEDEPLIAKFHEKLSEQTVYRRYFEHLHLSDRVRHERLTRICFNDYDREIALVAEHVGRGPGDREIVGVARLSKSHTANEAEFAVLVTDEYQRRGIGTELLRRLAQVGRDEKLHRITGQILRDNYGMLRSSRKVGFQIDSPQGGGAVEAHLDLESQP